MVTLIVLVGVPVAYAIGIWWILYRKDWSE